MKLLCHRRTWDGHTMDHNFDQHNRCMMHRVLYFCNHSQNQCSLRSFRLQYAFSLFWLIHRPILDVQHSASCFLLAHTQVSHDAALYIQYTIFCLARPPRPSPSTPRQSTQRPSKALAYPHGYVMIRIGVCATLQVVASARGLSM